jgi:hypothetical protein
MHWEWWLCDHSNRPEDFRPLMNRQDWLDYQISRRLPEERLGGFNSIHKGPNGTLLVTLMKIRAVVQLTPFANVSGFGEKSGSVHHEFPHDIQLDERTGKLVYGAKAGFIIDEKVVLPCEFVKRIRQIEDGYIITHEKGVVVTDMDGKEKKSIPLPRPFGVFHLEM